MLHYETWSKAKPIMQWEIEVFASEKGVSASGMGD